MHHDFCCVNKVSRSWRAWKANQQTPTYLIVLRTFLLPKSMPVVEVNLSLLFSDPDSQNYLWCRLPPHHPRALCSSYPPCLTLVFKSNTGVDLSRLSGSVCCVKLTPRLSPCCIAHAIAELGFSPFTSHVDPPGRSVPAPDIPFLRLQFRNNRWFVLFLNL